MSLYVRHEGARRARLVDGGVRPDGDGGASHAAARGHADEAAPLRSTGRCSGSTRSACASCRARSRPPFRPLWAFRARSLVEFPPVDRLRAALLREQRGRALRGPTRKTGRVGWRYDSGRCIAASPAVAHGVVYEAFLNRPPVQLDQGSDIDGQIVAFDASTGRCAGGGRSGRASRRRSSRTASSTSATGAATSTRFDARDRQAALELPDGRQGEGRRRGRRPAALRRLLRRPRLRPRRADGEADLARLGAGAARRRAARFYSTPAVAYGRVYIGSTDGKVYSFGATTGELRWSHSTGGYVYASPAVWSERVYSARTAARFYAFDAATGDVRWQFQANGPISGSATVLGDVVYFSTLNERTYALDARTGKLVWSFPDGKYSPVVADTDARLPRRLRADLCDGPAVRYAVTGAAGFIGSHLAERARRGRPRGRRDRLLHRLLRPAR